MHYSKLIKNLNDDRHVSVNNAENNVSSDGIIQELRKLLEERAASNVVAAPPGFDDNELNDVQIDDVLSYLMECQEKYFSDIPLADRLCQKFMWNIPKSVYKAFKDMHDYGPEYDIVNPILLFYIFCAEDPRYAMARFMDIIVNMVIDDKLNIIDRGSIEYQLSMTDEEAEPEKFKELMSLKEKLD